MLPYSFLFTSLYHFKRNGDRICAGRLPQHTALPRTGTHEMLTSPLSPPHLSHDPLLTELSPKTTDDGLLRAVLGCALLAFGCSARTSILRAQRLGCLGWHLCTHSDDLTARHPCLYLFTHICTSFSSLLCSLFYTCHRSRLCTQVIMSIPVNSQFPLF